MKVSILEMEGLKLDARRMTRDAAARGTTMQRTIVSSQSRPSAKRQLSALFVLNSLNVGGSETKTVRLANALTSRGVRAGIAVLNGPEDLRKALRPDVPVWHLHRTGKFSFAALRTLRALIREQQPSAVLSVNLYPALYLSLADPGSQRQYRSIALLNTTILPAGQAWKKAFYQPFLHRLDRVVYGCERHRDDWATRAILSRSSVIYNGVDTERFAPWTESARKISERAGRGIPPNAFVIGTVGRLAPEKNQRVLIDALSGLRKQGISAHLLLVGEGGERGVLEAHAERMGVKRHVTFAGVQQDVRTLLSIMDVFVLPSTRVETFSNAALEAMAMGLPVVLSRIGGADEMIRNGIDGYTLGVDELSASLVPLLVSLQADERSRALLGRRARERVERRFSFDGMVDAYEALIAGQVRTGSD